MECSACRLPREVRLEARNCTIVVPDVELSYLAWSTTLYASPLAYAKRVTGWLRKQLSFSYEVRGWRPRGLQMASRPCGLWELGWSWGRRLAAPAAGPACIICPLLAS